jgi:hypothetical protein
MAQKNPGFPSSLIRLQGNRALQSRIARQPSTSSCLFFFSFSFFLFFFFSEFFISGVQL